MTNKVVEYGFVRFLALLGLKRAGLVVFDQLDPASVSLRLLKFSIELARNSGDDQRLQRYIEQALKRFPFNTLGYLESANEWVRNGNTQMAREILLKAPKSAQVSAALSVLRKSKISGHQDAGSMIECGDHGSAGMMIKGNLRSNVLSFGAYALQARKWLLLKHSPLAVQLLEGMPKVIPRGLSYYLLLASAYEIDRDQLSQLRVLLAAQKNHPNERRLLLKISDVYRDDRQIALAYVFTKAAQVCYPIYGTVRRLSFECNHEFFAEASEALERINRFEAVDLLRFMPIINRVSVFFPDQRTLFAEWRKGARETLWVRPFRSATHLDKMLVLAIKCRWLADARSLVDQAGKQGLAVVPDRLQLLERAESDLGEMRELLEVAYLNEQGEDLIGFRGGFPRSIDTQKIDRDKTIEVFIPTAFFSEDNRPVYATIRTFLRIVYAELLGREDLVIVPRHQYNWRNCCRRLDARALSYHTNAFFDPYWLHVQEAPLAGRCSLDHQGFAGYSSLARDFSGIQRATEGINITKLRINQREMYEQYVLGNLSKYAQPEEKSEISGKYVFVALQIPTDVVSNLAWLDGLELLRTVADFYAGSKTQVVVKRHPYCTSMSVQAAIGELVAAGKAKNSIDSVHALIEGADAVFTVNSGVGLESLMHLKPVVVTGDCDYRYGVAAAAKTTQELVEIMESPIVCDEARTLQTDRKSVV